MSCSQKTGAYSKLRFDWKKEVNASEHLSRGAKHLATYLCDCFVNKDTGCCWPKNETLAKKLALSKRSIQRQIKELLAKGWLRPVKIKNVRRAFQIAFPRRDKGDIEHDILSPSSMTNLSFKDDKTVTPYKNQENNQERVRDHSSFFPTITINENEEGALNGWNNWLAEYTKHDVAKLLELLKKRDGYVFPTRFPKGDDGRTYRAFFQAVISSNGSILPG